MIRIDDNDVGILTLKCSNIGLRLNVYFSDRLIPPNPMAFHSRTLVEFSDSLEVRNLILTLLKFYKEIGARLDPELKFELQGILDSERSVLNDG